MTSYNYSCEFLEGKQDKTILGIKYGETKHIIDLVLIRVFSSDNREYYSVSKEFNLREAWNRFQMKEVVLHDTDSYIEKEYWIRENVLKPIYEKLLKIEENNKSTYFDLAFKRDVSKFSYSNMKYLINKYGKSNKQITEEIKEFFYNNDDFYYALFVPKFKEEKLYSIYNDVLLYQLFTKMLNS